MTSDQLPRQPPLTSLPVASAIAGWSRSCSMRDSTRRETRRQRCMMVARTVEGTAPGYHWGGAEAIVQGSARHFFRRYPLPRTFSTFFILLTAAQIRSTGVLLLVL